MGLNDLCQRCEQLMSARWVEWHRSFSSDYVWFPVQDADETEQDYDEALFRKKWPTSRIFQMYTLRYGEDLALPAGAKFWIYKSRQELSRTAAQGHCHLCALVSHRQSSNDNETSGLGENSMATLSIRYWKEAERISLEWMWLPYELLEEEEQDTDWWDERTTTVLWGNQSKSSPPHASSGKSESGFWKSTIPRLQAWMTDCERRHPSCQQRLRGKVDKLPTRLLHIHIGSGKPEIKLVETTSLRKTTKNISYATLSHCWGERGIKTKLLMGNHQDWLSAVPFTQLSKTFREAIWVTAALGIQYLWIDALCIVQDGTDWNLEAPRMQNVYSGSQVTLAAAASRDGEGGLLVQDYHKSHCTFNLGSSAPHRLQGSWQVLSEQDQVRNVVEQAPLNLRAWVLQERLLSRRLVYFTESQLYWSCLDESDCENPSDRGWKPKIMLDKKTLWTEYVETYSMLDLSFPTDKPTAISGIAEAFAILHSKSPDDYLAGIWRDELERHILWQASGSDITEPPDTSSFLGRPTWSWSSQPRAVWFPTFAHSAQHHWQRLFEVVDAYTSIGNQGPYGATNGGILRIRAAVLAISDYDGLTINVLDNSGIRHSFETTINGPDRSGWRPRSRVVPTHIVPMMTCRHATATDYPIEVYFLLVRTSEAKKGTYTRVNCWLKYEDEKSVSELELWTEGHKIDESLYLEDCGDRKYMIEIE